MTEGDGQAGRVSPTKLTEESDEAVCRICWGTEQEDKENEQEGQEPNPLISPCKCTGTMGLIHLKCLRGWLDTRRQRKENGRQTILKFNKLDCELCNTNFPFKISYKNQIVDIVGVDKPKRNYIILESLSNENTKIFHIINTENLQPFQHGQQHSASNRIKIGRGADSDVRVADDISVSRSHAYIQKAANGSYYLIDNKSKFGTLVQLQYPVFLSSKRLTNQSLTIQSGKTCMTVNVRLARSCTERYSCLRALTSCFSSKSKQHRSNIITLDGVFFFTKEFLDLKQFHSTKAQAIVDCESDEDEKRDERLISPTQPERQATNRRSAGRYTEVLNQPASLNRVQTGVDREANYGGIIEM